MHRVLKVVCLVLLVSTPVFANHPVFVEGNCFGPGALQRTIVAAGTCGDYDGDGRIGTAEDIDEADRVFGTINAALGLGTGAAAGTGANQNGRVIIVTSGSFAEVVTITAANGNVQLEGAPGVDANIDAIVQGVAGGAGRQNAPGIIVDAPANRHVVLRNLVSRNWAIGIDVRGNSNVAIEESKVENNANWGILVQDGARVSVSNTDVLGTGRRVGAGTDFPGVNAPAPGVGIEFEDTTAGAITFTTVNGSFRAGIKVGSKAEVCHSHNTVFNNNPNIEGSKKNISDCDDKVSDKEDDRR